MRRRTALWFSICSLVCGCAAGLAAPAALASGSPAAPTTTQPSISLLNPGGASAATTTTPVTTGATSTGSSSSSSGLSTLDELVIGIVAALMFVAIGYFVQRDARSHLAHNRHADRDPALYGQRAHPGSKAPRKPRKPKPAERRRRKRGRAR